MQGRFATGNSHHVGLAFVGNYRIEHSLYRGQVMEAGAMGAAFRIANWAPQIAVIGDISQGEAVALHVLGGTGRNRMNSHSVAAC